MCLCTCVSKEGGDEEGTGSEALFLLSLDTDRRKVAGANRAVLYQQIYAGNPKSIAPKKQRSTLLRQAAWWNLRLLQPDSRNNPTWDCNHLVISY
jgi:hypothetical protein